MLAINRQLLRYARAENQSITKGNSWISTLHKPRI